MYMENLFTYLPFFISHVVIKSWSWEGTWKSAVPVVQSILVMRGGLHLPAVCPGAAWTPVVAGDSLPPEAIYFISSQLSQFPFLLKTEQKQYPAALFHWGQFIPEGQTQWIKTLVLDSFLIKGEDSSHSSVVKTSLNLSNILQWAWFVCVRPCCCVSDSYYWNNEWLILMP